MSKSNRGKPSADKPTKMRLNSRTEQNMGGMQMITLTQCDMKRSVQLNPNTQMYFLYYWEQDINSQMTTMNNGNTTTVVRKGGCGFGSFVNVLGKVVSQTGIGQTKTPSAMSPDKLRPDQSLLQHQTSSRRLITA